GDHQHLRTRHRTGDPGRVGVPRSRLRGLRDQRRRRRAAGAARQSTQSPRLGASGPHRPRRRAVTRSDANARAEHSAAEPARPTERAYMSDAPGPRLTDAEFFTTTLIARDRPLLAEAARAAESGDVARARTLFARDVRESLQPERFLSVPRSFSDGGSHMHEGESALEAAERILAGELISCGTPIRFAGDVDWFA